MDKLETRPIAYSEIEVILYLYTLYAGSNAWTDECDVEDWPHIEATMRARTEAVRAAWNLPESGPTWPTCDTVESWRFRRAGPLSQDEADRVEVLWSAIDARLDWPDEVQHFPLDWVESELIDMAEGLVPLFEVARHLPPLTLELR